MDVGHNMMAVVIMNIDSNLISLFDILLPRDIEI